MPIEVSDTGAGGEGRTWLSFRGSRDTPAISPVHVYQSHRKMSHRKVCLKVKTRAAIETALTWAWASLRRVRRRDDGEQHDDNDQEPSWHGFPQSHHTPHLTTERSIDQVDEWS